MLEDVKAWAQPIPTEGQRPLWGPQPARDSQASSTSRAPSLLSLPLTGLGQQERCCCCQLPRPPRRSPWGGWGVSHTHTPRTHRCKGFRPQGQGGDFPKQLETDPPRDSGCITAAGLFQGPWTTYSFGPARGWGVPPHQRLSCLCLFPTGLLGASVSSAWPQPPNLSSRLSMQSQQICCHGRWQNSRAARGHQEGCAEPQARGVLWEGGTPPLCCPARGGGLRRGELPQTQNRCWQQN